MLVCGFSFIRNAVKLDFPVVESISSVLPICDKFVVAVGNSDDNTREIIENIDPQKIIIIDTVWNNSLDKGGAVYAEETDKAFDAIPEEYDWCFYLQGDEVVHEKYLKNILQAMRSNLNNFEVDGLLFGYKHFFGTYDYIGDSRKWYRNEIRIIRNDKSIRSYRDAQGFRKSNGRKLKVVPANAYIYHYGWVRQPVNMQNKINEVKRFYEGSNSEPVATDRGDLEFNYGDCYDALTLFKGTHPKIMEKRIKRLNWQIDINTKKVNMNIKYKILYFIEKICGVRLFEYRNYKLLKRSNKVV